MKKARTSLSTLIGLLIVFAAVVTTPAFGGGIGLRNPRINGIGHHATISVNEPIEVCADVSAYVYSGESAEVAIAFLAITKHLVLSDSVGKGGVNDPADVQAVLDALSTLDVLDQDEPLTSKQLSEGIRHFQRSIGLARPDGRIDLHGKTLRALKLKLIDSINLWAYRSLGFSSWSDHDNLTRRCFYFEPPDKPGKYDIVYSHSFIFVSRETAHSYRRRGILPERELEGLEPGRRRRAYDHRSPKISLDSIREIKDSLLMPIHSMTELANFTLEVEENLNSPSLSTEVTTYLKLNGEIPEYNNVISPGAFPAPTRFTWDTRPKGETVEYRYRLYPDTPDWSPWEGADYADYFFIGPGSHTFAVESRIRRDSQWIETPAAEYSFYLDRAFVSRPVEYKAEPGKTRLSTRLPELDSLYTGSKALLVGITDFANFEPIGTFVKSDVEAMKLALRASGFSVTEIVGSLSRQKAMTAVGEFVSTIAKDDRAIIYFSTHGFSDKNIKSKGYLATADCDPTIPGASCIALSELEDSINIATARGVRHVLLVLDACSAGLGTIDKGGSFRELNVAAGAGAHIITAGTADEVAVIKDGLSTFTRSLAAGLNIDRTSADYTRDGIVTLTELLIYVRFEVSKSTNGTQTPTLGKLGGKGEMVFYLN